ncbi:hypothetical protein SteCoe_19838 [Stentor coeruleus]|uniref:Autophagy-related protein n=1 Tax=Stentor coeruleus TaxID=5963 RepID=A0A1R2BTV8_9CILI|nr:hypothetical protein SteCoe_19838 [Stentor coeruleus]
MSKELRILSFEARREKSANLLSENPGKIPVVMLKGKNSKLELEKHLYLVSNQLTLAEFLYSIRKSIRIDKSEGFYLFVSDRLPPLNLHMLQLYQRSSEDDGFLYITYTTQEDKGCDLNLVL